VSTKQLKVFAPASIANLGPGFDVFGIAISGIGDFIEAKIVEEPGVSIEVEGVGAESIPVKASENSAGAVFWSVIERHDPEYGFHLRISKGVPPGKGLGSSGASAAASAVAVDRLLGLHLSEKELVELAAQGEAAVAGSAHADNVSASLLGGFVLVGENYDVIRLDMPDIGLVVVMPDVNYKNKTKMARELLPKQVDLKDAVANIGNASMMVAAVATKNPALFGKSIRDVLVEPYRARMIPHFDEVKKAALGSGAYGCSISGGGPSMFAVGPDPSAIGDAMRDAFGDVHADIYITRPSNLGARVVS
jgi:homoserine kinase